MRTETRTVRIGERVGDIDWEYNFRQHFDNYCTTEAIRDDLCEKSKEQLRQIERDFKAGRKVTATTDGGWPKFGYQPVIDVGMYDGWPFWKPVPSVQTLSPLGPEWHSFSLITDIIQEAKSATEYELTPIWITVDNGEYFEGHQGHWANTFFGNATIAEITQALAHDSMFKNSRYTIHEMTAEEIEKYPELAETLQFLRENYGTI